LAAWRDAAAAWQRAGDGPGQIEALCAQALLLIRAKPLEARLALDGAVAAGKAEVRRPLAAAAALHQAGIDLYMRRLPAEPRALLDAALGIREHLAPNSMDV